LGLHAELTNLLRFLLAQIDTFERSDLSSRSCNIAYSQPCKTVYQVRVDPHKTTENQ